MRKGLFPLHGKVPFEGQLCEIVNRQVIDGSEFYTLLVALPDGQTQLRAVHRRQVVEAIEQYARYEVGALVPVDRRIENFRIWDRKWNFKEGTVIYVVGDVKKRIIIIPYTQEHLVRMEEHHRAQGTLLGDLPEVCSDPASYL